MPELEQQPALPLSGLGASLDSAELQMRAPSPTPPKAKRAYKKRDPSKIIDGKTGLEVHTPEPSIALNPDEIAPSMGEAWALLFMSLGKRVNCSKVQLEQDEQTLMGKNSANVLVAWCPRAEGKYAVTIAALSGIATVFATKYALVKEAQAERLARLNQVMESDDTPKSTVTN